MTQKLKKLLLAGTQNVETSPQSFDGSYPTLPQQHLHITIPSINALTKPKHRVRLGSEKPERGTTEDLQRTARRRRSNITK